VGRAARNVKAKVIFYADKITNSMQLAMDETSRRRDIQKNYNLKNNIEPLTIIKSLPEDLRVIYGLIDGKNVEEAIDLSERCKKLGIRTPRDAEKLIDKKKKEMLKAAQALDFENAARLRDEVRELKSIVMSLMSEDLGE
jgi:excinuclease ABC subunit B